MSWRKNNKLTRSDSWYIVAAALAGASCTFIFHETLTFCVLSEIRPIPWFLNEEIGVFVDPSTWTSLNKVEPGTSHRDYLSSSIVLQSYVRILRFVQHLVCEGHLRISNVPSYSTVSLGWMQEYPDNTVAQNHPWLYIPYAIRSI